MHHYTTFILYYASIFSILNFFELIIDNLFSIILYNLFNYKILNLKYLLNLIKK